MLSVDTVFAVVTIEAIRRNERRKLSATLCNTVATAILAIGALTPVVALILGIRETDSNINALGSTLLISTFFSIVLHFVGRHILTRLEE